MRQIGIWGGEFVGLNMLLISGRHQRGGRRKMKQGVMLLLAIFAAPTATIPSLVGCLDAINAQIVPFYQIETLVWSLVSKNLALKQEVFLMAGCTSIGTCSAAK